MIGMDVVIELRMASLKPSAVFLTLVRKAVRDPWPLSNAGIVTVDIGAAESLADLDLRPLTGLRVHVIDSVGDRARHRTLAAMVAAVDPALLVMPILERDQLIVHRRFAGCPPRTETFHL